MAYPEEFGEPCWTQEQVAKVVSHSVEARAQSAPHFLAAHSPFRRISDSKAGSRILSEDNVFQDIFSPGCGEVQAFVKGEPGTGKSHLIRWLKLRSDYAAKESEMGLPDFELILVPRGTGSLKDALQQIVAQLGKKFEKHLSRVRGAIEKLSVGTARATMLAELALEIDRRWSVERNRPPLPNALEHLGQALGAKGFGRWLLRDGAVVDQVIRRLTEESTVEERENFPAFAPADFKVPLTYLRPDENSRQVIEFANDLEEDLKLREKAAEVINVALQDAIRELTGLRGSNLLDIFSDIRRELHKQGKSLAIFIEDVSVTGLDQDVINAFEPRAGEDLCRMVAVLGITTFGWDRMPDNQRQRGTHIFQVGGDVVKQWASDEDEVAGFTARYLNAVRMSDQEALAVAKDRFSRDVRKSKCAECKFREPCHDAFGKVDLGGGVSIGMFPLTKHAPAAMLDKLVDVRDIHYKSQRGLLVHVLLPTLDQSYGALSNHEFPNALNYSVHGRSLPNWEGFTNNYCGGAKWDSESEKRLRFLAQFWATADNAEDLAAQLEPLLAPLGLPKFSQTPRPATPKPPKKETSPATEPKTTDDPKLLKLLENLDAWRGGKDLMQDSEFRNLLERFLKEAILWQDERNLPISERRLVDDSASPRIKGQLSKHPSHKFFVDFDRDTDTYELLRALVHFDRSGKGSWDFLHGELHKRNYSRWLRKHRQRVIDSLRPRPETLRIAAIECAIQILAVAATVRDHKSFDDPKDSIRRIFSPVWDELNRPTACSEDLGELIEDLTLRHDGLVKFLVQELGAGQGTAEPKDFIDPLPILRVLKDFDAHPQVSLPPVAIGESFWKPRFQAVSQVKGYGQLPTLIDSERAEIAKAINSAKAFLRERGYSDADVRSSLKACLEDFVALIDLQRGKQGKQGVLPSPHPPFDALWEAETIQENRTTWGAALKEAIDLSSKSPDRAILAFDSRSIAGLADAIGTIDSHLKRIEDDLKREEIALEKRGAASSKELLDELKRLGSLEEERGT